MQTWLLQKQREQRRNRLQQEMESLLRQDPTLPMRILLAPENHPGETPLGEEWTAWAVRQRQEVALAMLLRPDYLERMVAGDEERRSTLIATAALWAAPLEHLLLHHREWLKLPYHSYSSTAHVAVQHTPQAALRLLQDPEFAPFQASGKDSIAACAMQYEQARDYVLREAPHLGFLPSSQGSVFHTLLIYDAERAEEVLRIPGAAECLGSDGQTLSETLLGKHPAFAERVCYTAELARLPVGRESLAHLAVRLHEEAALLALTHPEIARIADSSGRTVAHEATGAWPRAARWALRDPALRSLEDGEGRTVRRAALGHASPSTLLLAMRTRLEELLPEEASRSTLPPPGEPGIRGRVR